MGVLGNRMVERVKNKIIKKKLPFNLRNAEGDPNRLKVACFTIYQNGPEDFPPGGFFTWIEFFLPFASSSTSAMPRIKLKIK
jgi:hypothetical protein